MTGVSLEGADGVGKTTQSELLVRRLGEIGISATAAPTLNDYVRARTGHTHEQMRQWRLREADPVEHAQLLLAAQRERVFEIQAQTDGVIVIDRGARTLEAGCLALADLRGHGHSEVRAAIHEANLEGADQTHTRIALMYCPTLRESMRMMTEREARNDAPYARYLGFLYARLLSMESAGEFDMTVWTCDLDVAQVADRIFTQVQAQPRKERR